MRNLLADPGSTSRAKEAVSLRLHSLRPVLICVALVASAVVTPMVFLGNASGHDFEFHLRSWVDVAGQWREGTIFPRWAEWANWGYGEPRFVFYPPASWMTGAALGSMLPWRMAPGAYIWLCLVVAGLSMWRLARDWLAPPEALAAAVFFAVNPYHLVVVYYRSDFAELLASALFPLLVWGAARLAVRGWREVPFVSATLAAIWISNAPAAVIATYSLTLLLGVGCILRRDVRLAGPGTASLAGGLGLAAFYILPAAWEQRFVQIGQVLAENLRPEQNFLFAHANDPEFVLFNWKVSAVALSVMLIAGIAGVLAARRRREYGELWWLLVALAAASILMMFPASNLLWRMLPKLKFLQFPWRWLVPLGVVFGFMAGAAAGCVRRRWVVWLAIGAALGATGTVIANDAWWDSEDIPTLLADIDASRGFRGTDEYTPVTCDPYELPQSAPALETVDAPASASDATRFRILRWTAERHDFSADVSRASKISVRLLNYPSWELSVDGKSTPIEAAPTTGQILVPLAAGAHAVGVRFKRTLDRTTGGAISVVAALLLIAWEGRNRRGEQRSSH
jgi:hypothetical protein